MTVARRHGVGIPVVLFFIMLILFVATIMVMQANEDLRYTRLQAERTRLLFAAKGVANEAVALLNSDSSWESHSEGNPYRTRLGDFELQAWCVQDPDIPSVLYVHGRAHPAGKPGLAQSFTRSVLRDPEADGVAFSVAPHFNATETTSIFRGNGPNWELLPPVPHKYFNQDGTVGELPGKFALTVCLVCADGNGHLYAKWDPSLDDTGSLIYPILMAICRGLTDNEQASESTAQTVEQAPALAMPFGRGKPSQVVHFDPASQTWDVLPLPPAVHYSSSGQIEPLERGDTRSMDGALTTDGKNFLYQTVYRIGEPDFVNRYDMANGTWSTLPPAPNAYYGPGGQVQRQSGMAPLMHDLAVDKSGNVYAHFGPSDAKQALGRYNEGTNQWDILPPPPSQCWDGRGNLMVADDGIITDLAATPEGKLYAVLRRPPNAPGVDTVFEYSSGAWNAVPSPDESYHLSDGTLVENPGVKPRINGVASDADGTLYVRTVYRGRPDSSYSRQGNGDYKLLPALPGELYDVDGVRRQVEALDLQSQILGGGSPTGATRYEPVASY